MNLKSGNSQKSTANYDSRNSKPESNARPSTSKGINLTNFDPYSSGDYFLTSPRSIEACRRQGIAQNELLIKTIEDFEDIEIPPQFSSNKKEFLSMKLEFYERTRRKKLDRCLQMRKALFQSDIASYFPEGPPERSTPTKGKKRSVSPRPVNSSQYSSVNADRKLENLKKVQEGQMEKLISSEKKRQKLREDSLSKSLRIEEMKAQRADGDRDRTEQRRQEILLSNFKELQDNYKRERDNSAKRDKEEEHDHKQRIRQDRREKLQEEEAKWRMLKGNYKNEKVTTRMEQNEQEQERKANMKRTFTAEKLERAEQKVMNKREEKAKKAAVSKKELEDKLKDIAETQQLMDEYKRASYNEKSVERDQRKQKALMMRHISSSGRKEKSENRRQQFETMQEKQREEEEEQKRLKFNKEYESNKVRQQMFDDKEKARAERISRNNERKEEVKERQKSEQIIQDFQNQRFLDRLFESLNRADEQKRTLLEPDKEKQMLSFFREEEVKETAERQAKMREYKGVKIDEKLDNTMARLSRTKSEREEYVKRKNEIMDDHSRQKSFMLSEFDAERTKIEDSFMFKIDSTRSRSRSRSRGLLRSASTNTYAINKSQYTSAQRSNSRSPPNKFKTPAPAEFNDTIDTTPKKKKVVRTTQSTTKKTSKTRSKSKTPKKGEVERREFKPAVVKFNLQENEDDEQQEILINNARRKNLQMFLGLLDMEMDESMSKEDFGKAARKIARYTKGQDDDLVSLMNSYNYKGLFGGV